MAAIEISANDIETAIAQGLQQLNLLRAETKIEVLDEGSRGVLGIGAKPARVRLTPFADIEAAESMARSTTSKQDDDSDLDIVDDVEALDDAFESDAEADTEIESVERGGFGDGDENEDDGALKIEGEDLAFSLVRGILDRMGLADAKASARSVFPADADDEPSIWIDIDLDDEDLLLGYQSEGLMALQTVVQTMWSHQVKSSLRVNLDVNGYRARREQQLQNMARRMAERVLESGKPITLEPMRPSERRIVHMTLREMDGVETESFGEGSARKVQIKPKK